MIGLVTPFRVNNYGTKLQAYAVQKKIMLLGYDNEIIDYVPSRDMRILVILKKVFSPRKILYRYDMWKNLKKLKKEGLYEKIVQRNNAINSLDSLCYKCSPKICGYGRLKKRGDSYTIIICGSDQVWNPAAVEAGYSSVEFATKTPKVAFSPSFGVGVIPTRMSKRYTDFIKDFKFLSSREERGVEIILELTGRYAKVTADPTLTLSRTDWEEFCNNSTLKIPDIPYIFCYFLGTNPEHRKAVIKLKKKTGCTVITMPHFKGFVECDVDFADINLYDINPADFVSLISHAQYVCTDSFHGTVFSNIFHKDYFVFERYNEKDKNSTNSRIHSLLSILGTENRLIVNASDIEYVSDEKIDYAMVDLKLDNLKKDTEKYLVNALESCLGKELSNV